MRQEAVGLRSLPLRRATSSTVSEPELWLLAKMGAFSFLIFMGMRALGSGMGLLYSALLLGLVCLATGCFVARCEATALAIVAFLAITDPVFRSCARGLPYLTLSYAVLGWGLVVVWCKGGLVRPTLPFLAYGLYAVVEIVGLQFDGHAKTTRGVLIPSLGVVAFLLIAQCVKLDVRGLQRIVSGLLIGAMGVLGHLSYLYASGGAAQWGKQSNFEASGGAGPVQVSFVLAVGAFLAFWCAERTRSLLSRIIYGGVCMALLVFMLLTFSRGGIYIFSAAVLIYVFIQRKPSLRSMTLLVLLVAMVGATAYFVAHLTEGAFQARYADVKTTRVDLVQVGWRIFSDNFLFGVGTGGYYTAVEPYFGAQSGAHNEVIRAAAEHGVVGLCLWLLFYLGSVWGAVWHNSGARRALQLALLAIFLASVFHNGLKLIMQPLLILLALASFPEASQEMRVVPHCGRRVPRFRLAQQSRHPSLQHRGAARICWFPRTLN